VPQTHQQQYGKPNPQPKSLGSKAKPLIPGVSSVLLLVALFILCQKAVFADHVANNETGKNKPHIAILYPTVSKQHSGMYDQFISGITSVPGYQFISHRIDKNTSTESVEQWSKQQDIEGYIALGQTTYKLLDSMDSEKPLIAGGMVATPPGISGISLSGDPEAFFRQLQLFNPNINRVFFVYSQPNNGWLIKRARKISKKYNIEFVPLQVDNLKQATFQYKIILKSVRPKTDAIWIPLDNIAPMDILLPDILQTSWDKHITVFSNNMLHVRRGTLFALYPDHEKQGRRLVALLQRHLENNNTPSLLYPSVDFKTAINIRTATHLDLRYSKKMIKTFNKVFPSYK
jgi:ABC transporter substrate binding protein